MILQRPGIGVWLWNLVQEPSFSSLIGAGQTESSTFTRETNLRPPNNPQLEVGYKLFNPLNFSNLRSFRCWLYAMPSPRGEYDNFVRLTMPENVGYSWVCWKWFPFFTVKPLTAGYVIWGADRKTRPSEWYWKYDPSAQLWGVLRYSYRLVRFCTWTSAPLRKNMTSYEFDQPDQSFLTDLYAESSLSFLKEYYQFVCRFDYYVYSDRTNDFKRKSRNWSFLCPVPAKNKRESWHSHWITAERIPGRDTAANSITWNGRPRMHRAGISCLFSYALKSTLNPSGSAKEDDQNRRLGGQRAWGMEHRAGAWA
jgi:hypothetical protein